MEEKRTIKEFIQANKKKILRGAIIVVGIVAGVLVIKLYNSKAEMLLDKASDLKFLDEASWAGGNLLEHIREGAEVVQ